MNDELNKITADRLSKEIESKEVLIKPSLMVPFNGCEMCDYRYRQLCDLFGQRIVDHIPCDKCMECRNAIGEMSDELNRITADRLSKEIEPCSCEECREANSKKIFTELQIAQKRGEIISKVKIENLEKQIEDFKTRKQQYLDYMTLMIKSVTELMDAIPNTGTSARIAEVRDGFMKWKEQEEK